MQRTCAKCKEPFETDKRRYYCKPCRSVYNRAWEAEHQRKRDYEATYRREQTPKNRITAMQNRQETIIYCPACDKRTRHILYSAQSKAKAARWECQQPWCKRIRVISAPEMRGETEEVS